ncbi:DUF5686 and carboxypeptidase regulatory-like domain-containing protein [Flavobacterium sp. N1994]|uniref:DUF5686 and carboxypeptidase regulatory-like domain-containing protein n=1 Tax=Flavobacterium sp. N1994 TaxID=2986827 RepID=UPI002221805F|nr:DUF5686 and carboxypeptidase regulatory-like domain-containing protein [Flavobacterium sp. N1994]
MKGKLCTVFLFLVLTMSYGQDLLHGIVIDKETKEQLAFANILINTKTQLITDMNGAFSFKTFSNSVQITCSYVGYDKTEIQVDKKSYSKFFIELSPSQNKLDEIVIPTKENPANAIIQKVIANKEKNNPENINSFQYTSYNKIICDYKSTSADKTDSIKIRNKLKGIHFFMMESVTEKKFVKPNSSEEVVIGSKVSGFQDPSFATIATDFQPFSFYKDNIKLFDINYLNPISKGSLNKYKFHIEDTIHSERDTIYILSFKPKKDKNFEGLKGLLYINTNQYAVQNVIASPFEKGKIDIKIQQRYTLINNEYWFPEQLNFSLVFNELPNTKTPITLDGKSYLSNISLNTALDKKKFSLEEVRLDENATHKDSLFWQKYRNEKLTTTEVKTYRVIDSIGIKNNFDSYLTFAEKIAQSRIPLHAIDIDLSKTFVYNKYEGLRVGSGLWTNDRVSKKISLGGFLGYGIRDKDYKYGGEVRYKISKRNEVTIGIKYQNNLIETGGYGLDSFGENLLNYRKFIGYQYDQIKQNTFSVHFRSLRYLVWDFMLHQTTTNPKYSYVFDDNLNSFTNYKNTTLNVNLRFAYKEKLVNSFHQTVSLGTKYPVVLLSFSKGFKNVLQGDFNYTKVEAAVEHSFYTKNLGSTKYTLEAGYIDSPLPYGLLFTGEGSYDTNALLIMKNTFQTMAPYEFLSDEYVTLFLSHNFGGLLFKARKFQPSISLHTNVGWGTLSNSSFHKFIDFKTKDKFYVESGLQFDNIVKMNYLNVANIGFGFGTYYRYGAYTNPEFKDNVAFKFTLNISVK